MTCKNDLKIDFCEILNLNTFKQEESQTLLSLNFIDSEICDDMTLILLSSAVIVTVSLIINHDMMIFVIIENS